MPDEVPSHVVVAALASLLVDALERDETRHLANDRLRADLRGLRARVEVELEALSGRKRLRLAGEAEPSVADD